LFAKKALISGLQHSPHKIHNNTVPLFEINIYSARKKETPFDESVFIALSQDGVCADFLKISA
jgi:hypothetical protein